MRWLTLAAVVAPPLVLAGIGVSHPHDLTPDSAEWWTNMHIVLALLFPLLAVCHWVVLRGIPGPLAWASRILAFVYIGYYGALDALAGVGTGSLVQIGLDAGGGHHGGERDPAIDRLFAIGNDLGYVGAYAFVGACVLTALVVFLKVGLRALPGGLVLIAAGALFSQKHIYWPWGVVSQVGLAVGFGLITWVLTAKDTAATAA